MLGAAGPELRAATGADNAALTERSVLVVDDDPASLRCIGSLLMANHYRLYVAERGQLGIEIAERVRPDLILLDIRMPGRDGFETCRLLRNRPHTASIPIIFLTGRDDEPSVLQAFDAGGADYIVKPFEPSVLLARVRAHADLGVLSRSLERALGERTRELQRANTELRRLAVHLTQIEQGEKARLAAELHDSPMQKLALAQLQIDVVDGHAEPEYEDHLQAGRALLREAIQELRTLQFAINPPVLEQQGLGAALEWLAESTAVRSGIRMTCAVDSDLPPLPREASVILFQCARELAYNLLKHSGAKTGSVHLRRQGDAIELTVADDGVGLDPAALGAPDASRGGFGLYSVRERLALLGGELRIEPARPGTRVCVALPLRGSSAGSRAGGSQPGDFVFKQSDV